MSDMVNVGTIAFWYHGGADDWVTNEHEYVMAPAVTGAITVQLVKRRNKMVEVVINGPFSSTYHFHADMPACSPRGLFVCLGWDTDYIELFLNAKSIEKRHKDGAGLKVEMNPFSSDTDEGTRAAELAMAFHRASNAVFDTVAGCTQILAHTPSALFPGVVCEAFALELFLKSFLHYDRQAVPHSHKLRDLFDKCTTTTQQKIRESYNEWQSLEVTQKRVHAVSLNLDFDAILDDASEAFVRVRYIFETQRPAGDIKFYVLGLYVAFLSVAREYFPASFAFMDDL